MPKGLFLPFDVKQASQGFENDQKCPLKVGLEEIEKL